MNYIKYNMQFILDNREQTLYDKLSQSTPNIQIKPLTIGDAIIGTEESPIVIIERKSLTDLIASIRDGRYEEQSYRLKHASGVHTHNIIYVIEGMFSTLRSPAEKTQVISAMTSLSHFKGFSVFRTSSIQETADLLNGMYNKLTKEYGKGKPPAFVAKALSNALSKAFVAEDTTEESKEECPIENYASFAKKTKCENITPENMGEIILTQIPGIHSVTARAIMSRFQGKLVVLLDELKNPASIALDNITYVTNEKTRRINRTAIENLRKYLL